MTVTLPYPPSANRYWRHNRGIIHLSTEAKGVQGDGSRPRAGRRDAPHRR
jgi:hypothetical protein